VADLERMHEVRRLAREVLDAYPRIDVRANDAGAMLTSRRSCSRTCCWSGSAPRAGAP
jgi:NAD(P)-dependent dehydrogenase (short-subunit alcohol dehydrogenase family)